MRGGPEWGKDSHGQKMQVKEGLAEKNAEEATSRSECPISRSRSRQNSKPATLFSFKNQLMLRKGSLLVNPCSKSHLYSCDYGLIWLKTKRFLLLAGVVLGLL